MDRFVVEQNRNGGWYIKDHQNEFHSPQALAVPLYFKSRLRADAICNILNAEWKEFEQSRPIPG